MKKTDLAYLAGIIDGEGCVTVQFTRNKNGTGFYSEMVVVEMTNKFLPEWLHFSFGGNLRYRRGAKLQHKDRWRWQVVGSDAREFLQVITPYLILKKAQAEIVLKLHGQRLAYKHLTPLERSIQTEFAVQLKGLNKRGK